MKLAMISSALVVLTYAGSAAAAVTCGGTPVTGTALSSLITGNTVCASRGGDRWQEEHHVGGVLKDFKKGPSDPMDPTKTIGIWNISSDSVVYNYSGGQTYSFTVHHIVDTTFGFCKAGVDEMEFEVIAGTGVGCDSGAPAVSLPAP